MPCTAKFSMALQTEIPSTEISDLLKQIIFVRPFISALHFVFKFPQEKGFIAFPSSMTTVKADMKYIFRSKNTKQLYHNVFACFSSFFSSNFHSSFMSLSFMADR